MGVVDEEVAQSVDGVVVDAVLEGQLTGGSLAGVGVVVALQRLDQAMAAGGDDQRALAVAAAMLANGCGGSDGSSPEADLGTDATDSGSEVGTEDEFTGATEYPAETASVDRLIENIGSIAAIPTLAQTAH